MFCFFLPILGDGHKPYMLMNPGASTGHAGRPEFDCFPKKRSAHGKWGHRAAFSGEPSGTRVVEVGGCATDRPSVCCCAAKSWTDTIRIITDVNWGGGCSYHSYLCILSVCVCSVLISPPVRDQDSTRIVPAEYQHNTMYSTSSSPVQYQQFTREELVKCQRSTSAVPRAVQVQVRPPAPISARSGGLARHCASPARSAMMRQISRATMG